MVFSSIPFLYYFLPVVLVLYFIAPRCLKNPVILVSSLVFYGWGEPKYVFLMVLTVLQAYVFGLLIEKNRGKFLSKLYLVLSVLFCLAGLLFFKYADFFIGNFNAVTGLSLPFLRLALPIGISFYTFQILSYIVDVYRGGVPAQKNPVNLATYVALFPQLIAGPIVRYSDIEKQLVCRSHTFEKTAQGIKRFMIGFGKKIILANTLGGLCEGFLVSSDLSVLYYWLYAVSYMLQIYFDFSGYSDMAIGLGKILGFDFLENFNYPFISKSITEFWRRWHMSLGSWFRDYVYIPMGGNRVNKGRWLFNIFTVWFLTGFWHGAEWNFILWGLYFGVLLVLEKFFFLDKLKKIGELSRVYTLFFTAISFMIFSGNNLEGAVRHVAGLFGAGNIPLVSQEFFYNLRNYGFTIIIGILGATPVPKIVWGKLSEKKNIRAVLDVIEVVLLVLLLVVCTAYLADGSFNPFLYFRF